MHWNDAKLHSQNAPLSSIKLELKLRFFLTDAPKVPRKLSGRLNASVSGLNTICLSVLPPFRNESSMSETNEAESARAARSATYKRTVSDTLVRGERQTRKLSSSVTGFSARHSSGPPTQSGSGAGAGATSLSAVQQLGMLLASPAENPTPLSPQLNRSRSKKLSNPECSEEKRAYPTFCCLLFLRRFHNSLLMQAVVFTFPLLFLLLVPLSLLQNSRLALFELIIIIFCF